MRLGRRRARRRRETSTRQIETFYEALYNFWGGSYFFGAPTPYVDGCGLPRVGERISVDPGGASSDSVVFKITSMVKMAVLLGPQLSNTVSSDCI